MAISLTLSSVASGYNLTTINANNDSIETAFQDALSRSGTGPNQMEADLDMNGNTILNLPAPVNPNDPVRYQDISTAATGAAEAAASAAAAATSETNAATSEANAAASEAGALASASNIVASERGLGWDYENITTMANPGTSMIRLNNATLSSVTAIAVHKDDYNTLDVSDYVATWGTSTNATKGSITVRKVNDSTFFAIYDVSASVTDNTDWLQVSVTYKDHSGTLTNGDRLFLHFTRTGDQGASGGGSGDMVSTNNLSDVANVATARSNLGLGALAVLGSVSGTEINNDAVDSQHYAADSIDQEHLAPNIVGPTELIDTAVTPGSYTNVSATVDQQGRITAMSNGSAPSTDYVLIESFTLDNTVSLYDFETDLSTYDHYVMRLSNINVSVDNVKIQLRTSPDGTTYDTTGYTNNYYRIGAATLTPYQDTTADVAQFAGNKVGECTNATITFGDMSDTNSYKSFGYDAGVFITNGNIVVHHGYITRNTTSAVQGIRIQVSSGLFVSGEISLYGLKTV